MSVLDALTILGSGVGQGYRGSQELQRQMAESKRKALLDERELAIRESSSQAQNMLAEAQKTKLIADTTLQNYTMQEAAKKSARGSTSITKGGAPLRAQILGQDINLPGDYETLIGQGDLLNELQKQRFQAAHPEYYTNYPPAGTAAAQMKYSPAEKRKEYLLKAAGVATSTPGLLELTEPGAYEQRVSSIINLIMNRFKLEDPEAFGDSLKVKTPEGKSGDRFKNVKVKK